MTPQRIVSVLVTFNPNVDELAGVFDALMPQVRQLIVVDNGSVNAQAIGALVKSFGASWIALGDNKGLAEAQNIGLQEALDSGAAGILLMDQDTVLHPDVVSSLVNLHNRLQAEGIPVGSVGNAFRDTHDGKIAAVWRAKGWRVVRTAVDANDPNEIEADFVIASGSLLPAPVLHDVGLMDAPLFIDLVDLEWGFRASARGYRHFQSAQVVMDHTIGAGRVKVAGRTISLHAPIRNYYWVRNALLLAKRSYIKPGWRLFFSYRAVVYLAAYTLKGDAKSKRLKLMLTGLWDGLRGRAGAHR
ncbi:glycosyltransferase family 2 protein [Tianweitania sp. BSSL-BM11]|uniref:Glycosyltransferase family 2 protein n=1 Tax=Tianweitania aestuarii TaxID=2814886 RepID=A0ABS5RT37_9HYPH|nr:glycosyltransferase family 2 protein [Tianweitania aestuarii]MBS9720220.1 glycosyltransferase family 2 protein [Tianweitania aestuarii]